eukprot:m.33967 g.33967  ORF g.33967 m.33967 type:complete len:493 (-) comp7269_c0_seq1:77-1555(-)
MAGARAANYDIICSAATIPTLDFQRALQRRPLRVPLLQRRYCWPEAQLRVFLQDAIKLTTVGGEETLGEAVARPPGPLIGSGHLLGRVVVSRAAAKAGAAPIAGGPRRGCLVLDGQQRFTTALVLLAAIRDVVVSAAAGSEGSAEADLAAGLAHDIEVALGVDPSGDAARTPALVPTFFDRESLTAAMRGDDVADASPDDSVTRAARFFRATLQQSAILQVCDKLGMIELTADPDPDSTPVVPLSMTVTSATALAKAVLLGFRVLWFDANEEDVWSVYERLAFREIMINLFAINSAPGIPLAEADLTRNYVVSFFTTEEKQLDVYHTYWVPAERAAIDAASALDQAGRPLLDVLFAEFIKSREAIEIDLPAPPAQDPAQHLVINLPGDKKLFPTYKGVRKYIESRLVRASVSIDTSVPTVDGAAVVEEILGELVAFATDTPWLATAQEEKAAAASAEPEARAARRKQRRVVPTLSVTPETNKFATTVIPPRK